MGSSNQQLYSLSWGEFGSSLTTAVQLLRGQGDLVDVTLAAGGRTFGAHKIVLSAASPFLLDLLKDTPCQHPVVMLAGVDADDLESLLEFVYRGQVSVEPSQLPSLLQAAHCLSIHGLSPPTILTQNGEEISGPSLPTPTESLITRETMNDSSVPPQRRKRRRRKSSSPSSKWSRRDDHTDTEERNHSGSIRDLRTIDYTDHNKDTEVGSHDDISASVPSEYVNHRSISTTWLNNAQPSAILSSSNSSVDNLHQSHSLLHQDQAMETKPHLHTLMPMQQYSPLHIPSFPGSMHAGYSPMLQNSISAPVSSDTPTGTSSQKIRGASDCPGVCPLCGSTLRQARNLRRHLLSSCKYRFNSHPNQSTNAETMEIKPEVEIPGYIGHSLNYTTDSGASNNSSCERIVCKPSLPPSPSSHSRSNVGSPSLSQPPPAHINSPSSSPIAR